MFARGVHTTERTIRQRHGGLLWLWRLRPGLALATDIHQTDQKAVGGDLMSNSLKIEHQVTVLNAAVHAISYALTEDQRAMAVVQFRRIMDAAGLAQSSASNEEVIAVAELRASIERALLHLGPEH